MAFENIRPFQVGLLGGFALLGVVSLILIATFQGFSTGQGKIYGDAVVIWGTLNNTAIRNTINKIAEDDKDFSVVTYVEKDPRTFEEELVNAIAENRAPDAILMSHEDLVTYRPKLLSIPYENFPLRNFKDTYLDGAEIFALSDGLYALPFAVDPVVMYWNRDIFSTGGLALPPATWEALTDTVQQLTLRDATRNILQSTVAFGEYRNVDHGKEVLLTLLLQSGSRMIEESEQNYVVALDEPINQDSRPPLASTLQFYTEFSNANSQLYSWNRAKENDLNEFLGGTLALYFGYGSEALRVRQRNPNLNFDVTSVPQGAGATIKRVYGQFYGLALLRSTSNPQGTYRALLTLSSPEAAAAISEELSLSPVHRSTIALGSPNPYRQTILSQALIARGWLDPGSEASDTILETMVEDVVSNRQKASAAAGDAVQRFKIAF